jgi:transcriptional regulator with XRE-family HTH domain
MNEMSRFKKKITDKELIVAYNIRTARTRKFDTLKSAADAYKVDQSHWSQWETAIVTPHRSTLTKLADFLKVGPDDKPEDYFNKPDNWDEIRGGFINELRKNAKSLKELYPSVETPEPDSVQADTQQESKSNHDDDIHILILKMYELVNHARKRADAGDISPEEYDEHMKTLTGIINVSMFGKK